MRPGFPLSLFSVLPFFLAYGCANAPQVSVTPSHGSQAKQIQNRIDDLGNQTSQKTPGRYVPNISGLSPEPIDKGTVDKLSKLLQLATEIDKQQSEHKGELNTKLQNLTKELNENSKGRFALTGAGIGISVATVALTVANPAANAVWIAGLGAAGGGLVTYQAVRADEGYSSAYSRQKITVVLNAYSAASNAYVAAWADFTSACMSPTPDLAAADAALSKMAAAENATSLSLIADFGITPNAADVASIVATLKDQMKPAVDAAAAYSAAAVQGKVAEIQSEIAIENNKLTEVNTELKDTGLSADQKAQLETKVDAINETITGLNTRLAVLNSLLPAPAATPPTKPTT